jgi:acetylornithine deacetylase
MKAGDICINELIEKRREEIIKLTCDLVRMPTVNTPPTGNELAGQLFFERCCHDTGLDTFTLCPSDARGFEESDAYLKDRSFKDRYNVIGIWKGKGGGRSLLLSGHMDVAPEEPSPWTVCKPFEPVIHESRLYGRGSADMKGGLAAAFMAVKILKESGWSPCGDVLIESVVDEEFAGANGTISMRMEGFNADFAINAEPTGLALYPASVGALILKITIKGTAGMPYTGEEIFNPAYGITKVIDILRNYEKYRNIHEPVHELWKPAQQKRSIIVTKVKAGETKEHGQLGTPIDAWVETVIQTYPGETEESSMSKFLGFFNNSIKNIPELISTKPIIEKEYRYVEPGECPIDHEGMEALKASFKSATGKEVKVSGAPFSCDLAAFLKYGNTPAVLFGPCGGNLHAPDEWVDIESLVTSSKVYASMIVNWCGDK